MPCTRTSNLAGTQSINTSCTMIFAVTRNTSVGLGFMVIDLVTFLVLEPYSKTDTTLLLNMRTLRLFGNELFLQIG